MMSMMSAGAIGIGIAIKNDQRQWAKAHAARSQVRLLCGRCLHAA
jgi:hypothetical protein